MIFYMIGLGMQITEWEFLGNVKSLFTSAGTAHLSALDQLITKSNFLNVTDVNFFGKCQTKTTKIVKCCAPFVVFSRKVRTTYCFFVKRCVLYVVFVEWCAPIDIFIKTCLDHLIVNAFWLPPITVANRGVFFGGAIAPTLILPFSVCKTRNYFCSAPDTLLNAQVKVRK